MALLLPAEPHSVSNEHSYIVIIDRHALSRSSLARILRAEFQDFVVLAIATAQELGDLIGKNISLVILNIECSAMTEEDVLETLAYLRLSLPGRPLMLLTQLDEAAISDTMISEVARSGVRGYVTDSAPVEVVLAVIRLVLAGVVYFPRSVVTDDGDCQNWVSEASENAVVVHSSAGIPGDTTEGTVNTEATNVAFTQREREVLATLRRGLSNKIIASELNLSHNTIKVHISHIMRKLRATNRTEVVILAQHFESGANGGPQDGASMRGLQLRISRTPN
jgi:DNA-binding NarL/FixJ family response regulator